MIQIIFRPTTGPATELSVGAGQGFVMGPPTGPDVFAFPSGKDGLSLVLGNGLAGDDPSKARGPLAGEVLVAYGGETRLGWTPVTIHDAGYDVLRFGSAKTPAVRKLPEWDAWWLRDWWDADGVAPVASFDAVTARLAAHDYSSNEAKFATNPDQPDSSTQRCCQYAWAGTIAACLGVAVDKVRDAALAWVDAQGNRPMLYYTADGKLLNRPDVWIGEQGMRKGYHGKWERKTTSAWRNPDGAHRAIHRGLTAAVAFGDPVALLWCRAMLAAILSEPSVAFVLPSGEARAFGYTAEALALLYKFIEPSDRVIDGIGRCVQSVRGSMGYAPNGNPFALMWPVEKIHGDTHVHPTVADCERYAKAHGMGGAINPSVDAWLIYFTMHAKVDGLPENTYTTAPGGIQWYLQGSTAWGRLIAYRGTRTAHALLGEGDETAENILRNMAMNQDSKPGIGEDGKLFAPLPMHDSVAPRSGRARQANIPHGGTLLFGIDSLMSMGERGKAIAKGLYQHPSMKLSEPELGCVEIAGLGAMREFGVRS